jgi:hypothetical protein
VILRNNIVPGGINIIVNKIAENIRPLNQTKCKSL